MRFKERLFQFFTAFSSFFVLGIISCIFGILVYSSWPTITKIGFFRFITSTDWNPVTERFGALSSIYGTFVTTIIALSLAIPASIGIAIFSTEIAPPFIRKPLTIAIELLAAIPSIIYGMWGFFTLSVIMALYVEPFLQNITSHIPVLRALFQGTIRGIDILTASVILSIMIIPFAASTAKDGFELTPSSLREAAYAIGCTRWEVIKNVVLRHSRTAIFGGILLSLGRALGETMAVTFVLGNDHRITPSLLSGASTITVTLANEFSEASTELYISSLCCLALVLFVISALIRACAHYMLPKEKER